MKSSQILRLAAKRVEDCLNSFGCYAINAVTGDRTERDKAKAYIKRIKQYSDGGALWSICSDGCNARIIGLCLAAAIAESEGD